MGIIPGRELLFFTLIAASLFDLYRYKVPNALLVSSLLISLIRRLEVQGFPGMVPWLTGAFVPFILCYFFYRCRMIGAGDSKLFSVIGSYTGVNLILKIMVVSLFTGAVMACIKMLLNHNAVRRFRRLSSYIARCARERKWMPYYDREQEGEDGIIPFSIAISFAVLICVY